MRTTKIFAVDLFAHGEVLDSVFRIIFENMTEILGEDPALVDEKKRQWLAYNLHAAMDRGVKTIVAFDRDAPCGFFQYAKIDRNSCSWDEMQIAKTHQKDGITLLMLVRTFLQDADFLNCKTIHAHINRLNLNSQAVASHAGFIKKADTERGAKYILERAVLEDWFNKSRDKKS